MYSGANDDDGASDQTLRARPRLGLLGGALVFVVVGALIMQRTPVVAWLSIAFFGGGALLEFGQTLLGGARLQLRAEGFTVVNLWRARRYRWRDVSTFDVFSFSRRGQQMVVFESAKLLGPLAAANRALSGCAGYLPGRYGMDPAALARLLNARRATALYDGTQPVP